MPDCDSRVAAPAVIEAGEREKMLEEELKKL